MSLQQLHDSFKSAVDAAVAAVTAPGQPAGGLPQQDFSALTPEELKRQLAGAVLQMHDDSFSFVPLVRATVERAGESPKVTVKDRFDGPGEEKTIAWMENNVKRLAPGILAYGGRKGALADGLKAAGASVSLAPVAGNPLTQLSLTAVGGGSVNKGMEAALSDVGAAWRPWAGGASAWALRSGGGFPTVAAANAATVARSHLSGGGGMALESVMRSALLEALGLADPAPAPVAASFMQFLAGKQGLEEPLTVAVALNLAAAGPSPPAEVSAAVAARAELTKRLGELLDEIPRPVQKDAVQRLVRMRTGGLAADHSGGATLAGALADAPATLAAALAAAPS